MDTLLIAQTNNEIMKELLVCLKEVREAAYEVSPYDNDNGGTIYEENTIEMLKWADDLIERASKWVAAEGK